MIEIAIENERILWVLNFNHLTTRINFSMRMTLHWTDNRKRYLTNISDLVCVKHGVLERSVRVWLQFRFRPLNTSLL